MDTFKSDLSHQLEVSAVLIDILSDQAMKYSVVCVAALVAVVSAQYAPRPPLHYGPPHRGGYGGLGGHGGGLDPLTLLLLQKDGGLGGSGGIDSLLPLLLAGGLGGKGKGGFNPLLLALLGGGKCKEKHLLGCTQPATANLDGDFLCGNDLGTACDGGNEPCRPCCTCSTTANAVGWPTP